MVRTGRARQALAVGITLGIAGVAHAQSGQSGHVGPDDAHVAAARSLAGRHEGLDVRWNLDAGTAARVRFAPGSAPLAGETPADCAAHLLDEEVAPLLEPGVRTAASDELTPAAGPALVLRATKDLGDGHVRVDFDEVSGRTPVLDASVSVELAKTDRGYEAVAVLAHYFAGVAAGGYSSEVEGSLGERFPDYREGRMTSRTTWTRAVVPVAGGFRPAFAVVTSVKREAFRVLVDALTGEELARTEISCSSNVSGYAYEKDPGSTPAAQKPLTGLYVLQGATQVTTDAAGNDNLAGSVTINNPGLAGPLMHVYVDGQQEIAYSGAADAVLNFGDASYHTDELAAWYHLNSYNAYFQATYPGSTQAATVRVGVLVMSNFANAFFSPTNMSFDNENFTGYIDMGIFGGRSAARDATVIRHEYTHYLMNSLAYLYGPLEAGGLNEGLADYFPCCQLESPIMGAWVVPPGIRSLDNKLVWPKDNNGDVHRVGNIFNGALWQARKAIEAAKPGDRLRFDQTVFKALLRFPRSPTLLDARDALVQADAAANQGAFKAYIEQAMYDHGIGPAPSSAPPPPPPPGGGKPTTNQPPVLGMLTNQTVAVGSTLTVLVTATDPNGDPVTIAASTLPGGTIKQISTLPAQALWSFVPTAAQVGTTRVTFTGSDGMLSTSATISVTVLPASATPGQTAPTSSGTQPSGGGSTVPASTSGAGASSGSSSAGGCAIAGAAQGSAVVSLPYGLALLLLVLRRRALALRRAA